MTFTSELIAKRHSLSCHYKCDYSTNSAKFEICRFDRSIWGVRVAEWLNHSAVVPEILGSNPGDSEKCWAVMELIVYTYLYEFILFSNVRVRCFTLC